MKQEEIKGEEEADDSISLRKKNEVDRCKRR